MMSRQIWVVMTRSLKIGIAKERSTKSSIKGLDENIVKVNDPDSPASIFSNFQVKHHPIIFLKVKI